MFGLSTFKLIGAAIAIAAIVGGIAAWKSSIYNDGRKFERAIWEKAIADQKAEAAALLQSEANKVIEKERAIAALSTKVETAHVEATAAIDAAGAKYNRLGKLYEQQKARCGVGGGAAENSTSAAAAVDHGGGGSGRDVPGSAVETLGDIARDADRMRVAFMACRDWVVGLPKIINP